MARGGAAFQQETEDALRSPRGGLDGGLGAAGQVGLLCEDGGRGLRVVRGYRTPETDSIEITFASIEVHCCTID